MDEVKDMRNIIKTEFLKLKRYSVIKAGIIMTTLSPLLSLFYSTANGGPTWTFDYFMQQVMISNCTLFFPIIIALIAGYIITREYTDDTMKNILTIPIPLDKMQTNDNQTKSGIIDSWVAAIKNDTVPEVNGKDALDAMKAIFAALESSESGQTVEITEED